MKDAVIKISGEVSFKNVMLLYRQYLASFHHPELTFDFSGVTSSDSSGLALMVEWIKLAEQKKIAIRFTHVSANLMSIASVAGLDKIIAPFLLNRM